MLSNTTQRAARKNFLKTFFCVSLVFLSRPLIAEETTESRSSKSISYSENAQPDQQEKNDNLAEKETDVMPSLNQQGYREESSMMALQISTAEHSQHEVILYDASTELISDFDDNGFYHRFSVSIDADTIYDTSYIFARLYLSYEGGPWNQYAVSNNYHIHGDSEQDTFVIETELAEGFPPGYYDIRIEIYDADLGGWLLSYGPYDDNSLSALPLEDSYYDTQYIEDAYATETSVVVAGHGHGGLSIGLLILPLLIALTRLIKAD